MALVFLLESGIQVQRVLLWLPQEIKIYILLMSLSDWGTFYGLMDKVFGWKPWQHRFDSCPPQSRDIYIGRILMTSCSVFSSSVGCIEPNILWWLKKKRWVYWWLLLMLAILLVARRWCLRQVYLPRQYDLVCS